MARCPEGPDRMWIGIVCFGPGSDVPQAAPPPEDKPVNTAAAVMAVAPADAAAAAAAAARTLLVAAVQVVAVEKDRPEPPKSGANLHHPMATAPRTTAIHQSPKIRAEGKANVDVTPLHHHHHPKAAAPAPRTMVMNALWNNTSGRTLSTASTGPHC